MLEHPPRPNPNQTESVMVKAEQQHSSHRYLDKAVIRIALTDARKLMRLGCSASDAAGLATPGAWTVYRNEVLTALLANAILSYSVPVSGALTPHTLL